MAVLPDLGLAALAALVVFLLTLGVLVVFVETVPRRILAAVLASALVLAAFLGAVGEIGLGLVPLGFVAAFLANAVFEWLTTR